MFNIYYINYEKAYEIAMLIDNKIIEQRVKEKENDFGGNGSGKAGTAIEKLPFIGKYMPEINLEGEFTGSKSHKVVDTIKVISTKSTMLDKIYSKAKEVKELSENSIGKLIKIRNVHLSVINENDVLGAKTMLSGAIGNISVEGIGDVNLSTLLEAMFKDSAYVLEGRLPRNRFKREDNVLIKIPMQAENELEHLYSISDLEIGNVTLVGIYRGQFDREDISAKLNRFMKNDDSVQDVGIESDDDYDYQENKVHYIDIIAVVQDISF